jgi:RhtB (resistance to homoserine/threonine) family protein
MHDCGIEFSKVALAHLLAVGSPGPDFAIVLRQSLLHGRRTATWTSVGVGSAILLHVAYSLLGIGLILKSSPPAFAALKYAGAAYLAWMGVQALRTRPRTLENSSAAPPTPTPTARAAWVTGFLTNALNPKVTLFFVALFVTVINPQTPKWIQAGYGLWMAAATMAWFSFVAAVFTRAPVRAAFLRRGHWLDRALGAVFIVFALTLALASVG